MTAARKIVGLGNDRSAGFTLVEALVALAVAAMFAAVLTRVVSSVRMNAQEIREMVEMMTIADSLLQQSSPRGSEVNIGYRAGFAWRVAAAPVNFTAVARRINPKKPVAGLQSTNKPGLSGKKADEAEAARKDAIVNWIPFRISVVVGSRSGRSYGADTISIRQAETNE